MKSVLALKGFPVAQWYRIYLPMVDRHRFYPWVGKIPWRREWLLFKSSCLENSVDKGAWWAAVHGSQRVRGNLVAEHTPTHEETSIVPRTK